MGLIPAHAGKTVCEGYDVLVRGAHPRSRGENQDENIVNLSKQGSSPLTRGKPSGIWSYTDINGLIPAHAGKTSKTGQRRSWVWAHPRSRGENRDSRHCCAPRRGSSPLTRGKRRRGLL